MTSGLFQQCLDPKGARVEHAARWVPSLLQAANFMSVPLDPIERILHPEEIEAIRILVPEIQGHFQKIFGKCDRHYAEYASWVERFGTEDQKRIFARSQRPDFKSLIRPDLVRSRVEEAQDSDFLLYPWPMVFSDRRMPSWMTTEKIQALKQKHGWVWTGSDDTSSDFFRGDVVVEPASREEFVDAARSFGEGVYSYVLEGSEEGEYFRFTRMSHHPLFQEHFEAIAGAFDAAAVRKGLPEETAVYFRELARLFREGDMVAIHALSLQEPPIHPRLDFIFSANLWGMDAYDAKAPFSGTLAVQEDIHWGQIESSLRASAAFEVPTLSLTAAMDEVCGKIRDRYQGHLDRYGIALGKGVKPNERFLLALTHLGDAASGYARIGAMEHGIGPTRQNIAFLEASSVRTFSKELSPERQKAVSLVYLAFHERTHAMDLPNDTPLPLCEGMPMGLNLGKARLAVGEGLAFTSSLIGVWMLKDAGWLDDRDLAYIFDRALQTAVGRYLLPKHLVTDQGVLKTGPLVAYPHAVGEAIFLHECDKKNRIAYEDSGDDGGKFTCPDPSGLQDVLWEIFFKIVDSMVTPRRQGLDAYYAAEAKCERPLLESLNSKLAAVYKRVVPPYDYMNAHRALYTA